MPRSPEQFDDIRKQKKELIMNTALELFAENGFHTTSISQIAAKANISKGLTYNYFSSKKEILNEIIEHGFSEIFTNLDLNHDGVLTEEEFVYFIRQSFKLLKDNMQHWTLFFSLLLQPKLMKTFTLSYHEKTEPFFRLFLEFIKKQGSKNPENDLMAIAAMIEGAFLYCIAVPDMFHMEALENAILEAAFKILKNQ